MDSVDVHLNTIKLYIDGVDTLRRERQEMVNCAKLKFGADEQHRVTELVGSSQPDVEFLRSINKLQHELMTEAQKKTLEGLSKRLVEARSAVVSLTEELEGLIVACLAVKWLICPWG